MVEVVNVVGSGLLNKEFELAVISEELDSLAEFDPSKYQGLYLRFSEDTPLITVYRTGKYIISGADSVDELNRVNDRFLTLWCNEGIINEENVKWFRVQNLVCMIELGSNLDLSALSIGLGLEQTEYEPEQFPGLIYRNPELGCVILIFSTGKAVITGSSDLSATKDAADHLKSELSRLQLN